jgi:L-asparaginase
MKTLLITTGGTISQQHVDGVAVSDDSAFTGDDFIRAINNTADKLGVDLETKPVLNKDSSNMIMSDWTAIAEAIAADYDNFDGFIVSHGTNTMGYSCSAISFALNNVSKPIIFTGSQVSYGIPGSDAVTNLDNILRIMSEGHNLAGVFCLFGSKLITSTRVKKKTEFDYDAFKTFGRIPDIALIGNSIQFNESALASHMSFLGDASLPLEIKPDFDNNIVSLTEFPGLSSEVFVNLAKSGVKGFILRATGAGDPNVSDSTDYANLRDAFVYLRDNKIPIVITTQAPDGVASMKVNEPGQLALSLGAIPAWDMSMESMVAKLAWLIGNGHSHEEIQRLMITSLRGEILTD